MAEDTDIAALLAAQFADPETGWSVGTFGAIAEFTRDADEPCAIGHDGLSVVTERGGISLDPVAGLRLVASEGATRDSWSQRVALCLPEDRCAMNRREVLTELGPDTEAIRRADRASVLFDLGLGTVQVDACVRVGDHAVVDQLRTWCGRSLFEPGNPAMGVLLAASPHRVFVGPVGRAEVFQAIPAENGRSPDGPHTHLLPKLLRHRRTHAATEPIPEGFVPCAHFYPAHPMKDAVGAIRPYEARCHTAFQNLMGQFGDAETVALKQRMAVAVASGMDPSGFLVPDDRFARTTVRVGLRQLAAERGPSPVLAAWQAAHDRAHLGEVQGEADLEDAAGAAGH